MQSAKGWLNKSLLKIKSQLKNVLKKCLVEAFFCASENSTEKWIDPSGLLISPAWGCSLLVKIGTMGTSEFCHKINDFKPTLQGAKVGAVKVSPPKSGELK